MCIFFIRIFMCITAVCISFSSIAGPASINPVKIRNGVNLVDFTGDGVPDMVVLGHRENFNAHSFDTVTFYIQAHGVGKEKEWNIVPVMEKNEERLEVTAGGGADCVVHDFRLLAGSGKKHAMLITASRELGASYGDQATVTFTYYKLAAHTDGIAGFPWYAFEPSHVKKSKAQYCDVEEAFQKELGIGAYAQ